MTPAIYCWQNDEGLEDTIREIRTDFHEKRLLHIFKKYFDPRVKKYLIESVQEIKTDKKTVPLVAKRLKYKNSKKFLKSTSIDIVSRMIYNMTHPPKNKKKPIDNKYYISSYLILSVLFAPYDENFNIDKKVISNNSAIIDYEYSGYVIKAFYIYKNKRWYLTTRDYLN